MRILFAIIVLFHGLIHLMGFAKAFTYGNLKSLTLPISKPVGAVWLLTAILFIMAGVAVLFHNESWWIWAAPAVLLSQAVIYLSWKDAHYGTLGNLIVLAGLLLGYGPKFLTIADFG